MSDIDELDEWLRRGRCDLVASIAVPPVADVLERLAREAAASPGGGPLRAHALAEVGRFLRRTEAEEVDLLQICRATGIPLTDARAALRQFAAAGWLRERVDDGALGDPSRRVYVLAPKGRAGIAQAAADAGARTPAPRRLPGSGGLSREGA